jgi:HPt (histidine-containing phosphotransfer) domain-containing protein
MCLQELQSNGLEAALKAGELDKAFDIAHKIKGGVTNLALTPIATPVCELTELLRNKTAGDYGSLCKAIAEKTAQLAALAEG